MAKAFAKAFYNSKEWQQARGNALMRDGYMCQRCGRLAEEVHHIVPIDLNNIGNPMITLNPKNLRCLCSSCHKRITKGETGDLPESYIFSDDGQVIKI